MLLRLPTAYHMLIRLSLLALQHQKCFGVKSSVTGYNTHWNNEYITSYKGGDEHIQNI